MTWITEHKLNSPTKLVSEWVVESRAQHIKQFPMQIIDALEENLVKIHIPKSIQGSKIYFIGVTYE